MKRLRRGWRALPLAGALLVIGALALAACGGSSEPTSSPSAADTPKPGGTYNYVLGDDPYSIDATSAYESEGIQVVHQTFNGLVKVATDDQGNVTAAPDIAESWESADNKTWVFRLKKTAKFAAPVSTAITAQTFVDSWSYVCDENNQSPVAYILNTVEGTDAGGYIADPKKGLTGVKAIDDYTFEVTLKYPFADFVISLLHPCSSALPVDYIKEIGYEKYHEKPVGSGPYQVTKWVHKQYVDLVKNPDYWDTENAGYVDTIHMPIYVQSQTSWLQFQKGAVDYTHVPPGQVKSSQSNPKVLSGEWTAKGWPYITVDYVVFNMNDPVVGGDQGLELRKAMYMAADAQSLVNIVYEGQAVPATGFCPEGLPGYRPNVSPYKTNDVEGAKTALAAYGKDVPGLKYWYNTAESNQKTAEVLQAGWKGVGIDISLENFEWTTFLDKTSKGEGQVYRSGWIMDFPSVDNFLYPLFQSEQPPQINNAFYNNPEFDAKLLEARGTADATARYDLYAEAEKMMLTDAPAIPTVFPRAYRVTNNRIGGFYQDPAAYVDMWKLWVK